MGPVLCIFAHPDDEAFGPSGVIAKWAREREVYLICATDGDAAFGEGNGSLAKTRKQELLASANILGVKEVIFFDFADGSLSNSLYHKLESKIMEVVDRVNPEILLTFGENGISGHIDHIVCSMVSSFIFQKTKSIKEIWYNVILKNVSDRYKDYFIYFPDGEKKENVDEIVDITDVLDLKIAAIKAHESQSKDGNEILEMLKSAPPEEYFLVKKR